MSVKRNAMECAYGFMVCSCLLVAQNSSKFLINFSLIVLSDEDECAGNSHDCHADANCLNTIGSFSCACKDGHYGDGRVCSGIGRQDVR